MTSLLFERVTCGFAHCSVVHAGVGGNLHCGDKRGGIAKSNGVENSAGDKRSGISKYIGNIRLDGSANSQIDSSKAL